ncbi:MAG: four-carbon acid sugar kinase family protein, partial [Holosporales bacterium]|nr:four-carbon acid sugar kinase family protein [Holosporales bacterium]
MVQLLIIADDFTGALDTGVHFSKQGISTFITTDENIRNSYDAMEAVVWVCITQSRHLSSKKAYEKVANVTRYAMELGIPYIYKKTDSTLRGNIGSEIAAVLETAQSGDLMFIPAFPREKRITRNGVQYVNGCELNQSIFAQDPFEPVIFSHVDEIIRQQSDVPLVMVNRADVAIMG